MSKHTVFFRFRDERQYHLCLILLAASLLNAGLVLSRSVLAQWRGRPPLEIAWPEIQGLFGLAFGFLVWNLLLAWIPYVVALQLERTQRRGVRLKAFWGWLVLWLLFLPNSPYIVTDFIHLKYRPPVPVYFDMVLLFSFASTGLLLGLLSLYEIRIALRRLFPAWKTELLMLTAIGLSGFGVWLGRFQRWNSWDVLLNPGHVLRQVGRTMARRHDLIEAFGVSALIGSLLLIGYLLLSVMLPPPRHSP
ncbi:MAG: DUF1361 domain-containing protein [Saprospirales bacterium]|nr:DUF1361 domain-containing protein [Saprospirales bacterium]MBK8923347.1 DUF1361 domain-containing protein [Saprospirales bacterium]